MMGNILKIISWLSLACIVAFAVLYLAGKVEKDTMKLYLLIATIVWFALTPFWMGRKKKEQEA